MVTGATSVLNGLLYVALFTELFACELYNVGHLYEAAAAHFEVTGKRTLLEVALKNADLIDREFGPGPGQNPDVSGHEEIGIVEIELR